MARDRERFHPKSTRRHRAAFDRAYRSPVSARHYDKEYFPRQDVEKATVFNLVYKYLSKCANQSLIKGRQRSCACKKFNKQHERKKDIRKSDLATIHTNLNEEISSDDGEQSRSRTNKNILKTASRSSSNECVADYTRAVRDERRRAKFYIREALIYGLQSGLLIPTDLRRNMLRVSRKIGVLSRNVKKDNEDPSSIATSDTEYSLSV
ncbi:PREDICTED: uncharacterized protein LOC108771345 [Cyphomyrmex costatus]|uniref:Uncharacterized protein n=1 Tax=Cyphomyrmex costatus TaxID=456900 RepID=A0A151ILN7_9HYME|nr:PREDICTED: uncharacterized protein LOC108771345 [Cyphomyrmex costatus]KYN05802.1 hypothetical protein ALC62_03281 [Cyphomyrmex costatus]